MNTRARYISDPTTCAYDPSKEKSLLCRADGGSATDADCITAGEARTINAMWYGQTANGSSADPATLAGLSDRLAPGQLWFGLTRGSNLGMSGGSEGGKGKPFDPLAFTVAYELGRGLEHPGSNMRRVTSWRSVWMPWLLPHFMIHLR